MGFKDFLQKRKVKKQSSLVTRMTKKLMNPYGQKQERKRIIDILRDIEDPAAYSGMLKRYTFVSEKNTIVDEEEKRKIFDILVSKGDRVIPSVVDYLKSENMIYWPMKILKTLKGDEATITTLLDIINSMSDEYTSKDFDKRLQLISNLRDFTDDRILEKLLAWVRSEEEEIRFHAADGLLNYADRREIKEVLVDMLVEEDETTRIKNFILDQFIMNRWSVKKHRKKLKDKIPEDYWIDDTGVIQRK